MTCIAVGRCSSGSVCEWHRPGCSSQTVASSLVVEGWQIGSSRSHRRNCSIYSQRGVESRASGEWAKSLVCGWLEPGLLDCDNVVPDVAALAGTGNGKRFHADGLKADPFFSEITGFDTYRTFGQRAACRAVMSSSEGSTVISMLPTGSGKTEIALCLSHRKRSGVTVIVVPTVALAYDFERRFREHFARRNRRVNAESLHFAWTATTDEATRAEIRHAVKQGQQRLLITSPESMTRALRQTLLDSAGLGRLQGFVIDEAHLVTQWGRDLSSRVQNSS